MKVIKIADFAAREIGGGPLFTGGKVYSQSLLGEEFKARKVQIAQVKFAPGARNKFHTHSNGQILFVTEGKGIVATEDKEYTVTPGTLVFVSPNEVHRHGAVKDSSFAHLTIIGEPQEMSIVGE